VREASALNHHHRSAGRCDERPLHFCTYFDSNYLARGLALYRSLEEHCRRRFVLWIICFDDESYDRLTAIDLDGVRLIRRQDFERNDAGLARAREDRSGVEYFWTCTPSVLLFILAQDPDIELITYLDADLYFFGDPAPIFDELGSNSILIVGHRYAPEHAHFCADSGIYNVGLMAFRSDAEGMRCLRWWRERCIEWCYARVEDGKYGDQKYLDDWPQRFSGVVVLQHTGGGVAPWNISVHPTTCVDGSPQVDGSPLIFYHFHGLKCIADNVVYPHAECYRMDTLQLDTIYRRYALHLRAIAASCGLDFRDSFVAPTPRRLMWKGLLEQEYFLVSPRWLSLLLWRLGERGRKSRVHLKRAEEHLLGSRRLAAGAHLAIALTCLPAILLERRYVAAAARALLGDAQIMLYRRWRAYARKPQQ
jgi:hypothetical protein